VNDHVPHRDHLPLRHFGMRLPEVGREPSGRLTDDLDPADDGRLGEFVLVEGFSASGGLVVDALDRFQDVE
jgi:hypothetical protein